MYLYNIKRNETKMIVKKHQFLPKYMRIIYKRMGGDSVIFKIIFWLIVIFSFVLIISTIAAIFMFNPITERLYILVTVVIVGLYIGAYKYFSKIPYIGHK